MEEKQAKVHNKSKYRRAGSSRGNSTELASPLNATTTASPAVATPTTTPIVIVQSLPNDDEMAESPASSINVNSQNVQSGVTNTGTSSSYLLTLCVSLVHYIFRVAIICHWFSFIFGTNVDIFIMFSLVNFPFAKTKSIF